MRLRKKRYNVMLEPGLHSWASQEAARRGLSFSAYVSELISGLEQSKRGEVRMTREERVQLRHEIAEELLAKLSVRIRGD